MICELFLNGVRWNLRVVLILISFITRDVEHLFRYFSDILYSSVENSLFSSVPHFLIRLFDSLDLTLSYLYILDASPLSDVGLVKIFSQSVGCHFVLLLDCVICLTEALQFHEVPFVDS